MGESFPKIPSGSEIDVAVSLLKFYRSVLIEQNGKLVGIITRADLIKAME
jgi:predicted transcriptional regulator